jgi:NADPH-dependent 2,4-dienoyl-CoA reductase/sulfur reductase-like enzyme/rhodanese-related sulfurtransferase
MDIVVVGGGACGFKAACRARRRNEEANITVVDASSYPSLGRCGLPYYVAGIVHSIDDLRKTLAGTVRDENYFKRVKNIEVLSRTKAVKIDRERRMVKIVKPDGSEDELNYDYLVLATGAKPVRLNLPNADADGVTTLFNPEDAEKILEMWDEGILEKAVIIGGGLIGMEMAEALSNLDVEVTIVEIMEYILPALLDKEMALLVEEYLKEKDVKVLTSSKVTEILTNGGRVKGVKVNGTKEIPCDLVLMAVGVRPNIDLALDAGLEVGKFGIKVDEYLRTSDERIFAGGDCVENRCLITGNPVYTPMGTIANKHGRVIGDNVTGGNSKFPGVLGTTIFKVFELNVARTGLTEKRARELGYDVVTCLVPGPDKTHYYPHQKPIRVKLIVERGSGRILGAQIVGWGVVDKRIDVIASAIHMKATVHDLANFDLAYAPPYSTAIDTLIHSANTVRNKIDGLFEAISTFEVKKKLDKGEDVVLLDIRSDEEYRKFKKIEDKRVVRIPLEELRERLNELPKDKEIIIVCQVGNRAYEAYRILKGAGFENVKVMEGGLAFWFW